MEKITISLGKLKIIEENFKKAPNRSYTRQFLENKLKEVKILRNEIIDQLVLLEETLDSNTHARIYSEYTNLVGKLLNFIENKIPLARNCSQLTLKNLAKAAIICKRLSMADPFDIKTATALVQPYDGCFDKLDSFIDTANLLKELTKEAHMAMAIKFLKTRLSGKARQCLPEKIATIDELLQHVKEQCAEFVTPHSILAKLKNTRQNAGVEKFCTDVENLTSQLRNVYISQKIPGDVAKSMASKAGVDTLISGIKNPETKLILKAATFNDIKEAVQKINENSQTNSETNEIQVLHYRRTQSNQHGNYRGRSNFQRGNFNRRNFHDNQNRYDNNRNHSYDNRNIYNNNRNRFNDNRNQNNNFGRTRDTQSRNVNRNVFISENVNHPSTAPQVDVNQGHGEQITHPRT